MWLKKVDGSASWQTVTGTANLQMEMLHSGYNSSVDVSQLDSISSSLQPLDFVILVVNPQEAPDISSVSYSQVVLKLKFGIPGHRVRWDVTRDHLSHSFDRPCVVLWHK
jgi:hypothetical protein